MNNDVLSQIDQLLPTFRDRAQATEDARDVSEDSIAQLRATGFFKLLQPKRFGGYEADPMDHYLAIKAIATACGSTGWVASVLGAHQWHIATFSDEAQQEVWGENPDAIASSAYAPVGKAYPTEGGYTLSGRWNFSSGSTHADWAILGGFVFGPDNKPLDYVGFLVPKTDYVIDDVWRTVGLRGTGSNDIIVDEVFVPEHRALSFNKSFACDTPGQLVNTNPMYSMPLFSVMATTISTPLLGMAEGAYTAHVAHQRERVRVYEGKAVKDDPFSKVRVAEAASEIDAAWAQMSRNIAEIHEAAKQGAVPMEMRTRLRRDQVRGAGRAIFAIDRLFENSGARAIAESNPIQRFWRDAHAGRVHVVHDPELPLKIFGDQEFGAVIDGGML